MALAAAIFFSASIGMAEELQLASSIPLRVHCLLAAIAEVETQNDPTAVGDGGKAIGEYQIHETYWRDAGLRGNWMLCRNTAYARRVVLAYWAKYCPEALKGGNVEILARMHNGGPNGHTHSQTLAYWRRIQPCLYAKMAKHCSYLAQNGPPAGFTHLSPVSAWE